MILYCPLTQPIIQTSERSTSYGNLTVRKFVGPTFASGQVISGVSDSNSVQSVVTSQGMRGLYEIKYRICSGVKSPNPYIVILYCLSRGKPIGSISRERGTVNGVRVTSCGSRYRVLRNVLYWLASIRSTCQEDNSVGVTNTCSHDTESLKEEPE